jgi:hypothetical protein
MGLGFYVRRQQRKKRPRNQDLRPWILESVAETDSSPTSSLYIRINYQKADTNSQSIS